MNISIKYKALKVAFYTLLAAFSLAGIVFLDNWEYGKKVAIGAALGQFVYTVIMNGINTSLYEFFIHRYSSLKGKMVSSLIVSTFAALINFLFHTIIQTPDAMNAAFLTFIFSSLGAFVYEASHYLLNKQAWVQNHPILKKMFWRK